MQQRFGPAPHLCEGGRAVAGSGWLCWRELPSRAEGGLCRRLGKWLGSLGAKAPEVLSTLVDLLAKGAIAPLSGARGCRAGTSCMHASNTLVPVYNLRAHWEFATCASRPRYTSW